MVWLKRLMKRWITKRTAVILLLIAFVVSSYWLHSYDLKEAKKKQTAKYGSHPYERKVKNKRHMPGDDKIVIHNPHKNAKIEAMKRRFNKTSSETQDTYKDKINILKGLIGVNPHKKSHRNSTKHIPKHGVKAVEEKPQNHKISPNEGNKEHGHEQEQKKPTTTANPLLKRNKKQDKLRKDIEKLSVGEIHHKKDRQKLKDTGLSDKPESKKIGRKLSPPKDQPGVEQGPSNNEEQHEAKKLKHKRSKRAEINPQEKTV